MWIMLAMLAVFYAIVIGILYVTQQKTTPSFDEYAVGGRSYGPWYVAMSYVNSWWPGSTFIAFFGLATGAGVFGLYGLVVWLTFAGLAVAQAILLWWLFERHTAWARTVVARWLLAHRRRVTPLGEGGSR